MEEASCISELRDNDDDTLRQAIDCLLRIANNIIENPSELKYRVLKLSSTVITTKLLIAAGGMECIFAMGFQENDESLILPMESSLENLKSIREQVCRIKKDVDGKTFKVPEPESSVTTVRIEPEPLSSSDRVMTLPPQNEV